MRRRFVLFLAVTLAAMLLVVATVPLWLGVFASQVGPSRGLSFAAYERLGYSRFALREVEFRRGNVKVTASRVEAPTPVVWLWRHWTKRPGEITAGEWRVEVERNPAPKPPNPDRGWMLLRAQLQRIAAQLDRWLPQARIGAGVVHWPSGEVRASAAEWRGRELTATALGYRALKTDAVLSFPRGADVLRLTARTTDGAAVSTLESRGASVRGELVFWDQPAAIEATFAERGWRPEEATVRAPDWTIAGARLKLGEHYAHVRGSVQIDWRSEHFVVDIAATGQPLPDKPAPPLELAVRGQGDTHAFTIEALNATMPGITARLSAPVTVERGGKLRDSGAQFALEADLDRQPWFEATGLVRGEARVISGEEAVPIVQFSLDAEDVRARALAVAGVTARGRLEWPRIQVSAGTLIATEGEQLEWSGGWDFRAKELLGAAVRGTLRRASLARWLPKQPAFESVTIEAQAAGPASEVRHSGRATASAVKLPGVHPLAVQASWRGEGAAVDHFEADARAGDTVLIGEGKVDRDRLQLTGLRLTQGGALRLQLKAPAELHWRPRLRIDALQLAGPEGSLNVTATLGETGRVEVAAREFSSRWLADLVAMSGPSWELTLFALMGAWDRGPMGFSLAAGAAVHIGEGRTASMMASARGDKDGMRIEALRATEGNVAVVNATGRLPVTINPARQPLLQINQTGAVRLDAAVAPNSAFWQKLASMTGVELGEPEAVAHVTGTWQRPEGHATIKAARIAIDPKRVKRALPAIQALDVRLTGDSGGVNLDTFSLRVEGQLVKAQGRLPVPEGEWSKLLKEPLAAAQRGADLRIEVPDADVAVFNRFLPAVLAPKGKLQADIHYKQGGFEGFLKLRDAASRPLGPLGVLQEVNADVALSGRKLALRGVTARSGGQPVTLSGTVELPPGAPPQFDLSLRGENLPFVRQTGLLLRGDLDLKLQTPRGAVPRLSGQVRLRDSLFLSDVRAFLPKGGAANPTRRPPYFAVETPPVNAWTLAVDVVGDKFMRLRMPVFNGVASARFRLSGTLGDPRAIGEIEIDEGRVRMPFASFELTQGSVRLTEADPFEPTVYLRGTARRWGYDLTMEVEGNASQPNVVFTSSPPLDSEQVLLMVMTGAAPTNEVNKSGTQRMASIGYFLGQTLLGSLGADADAERLSIASGEKISRQGRETYDIEYRLSDRWTVIGEYNEFDEYNVGVKWRILRGEAEQAADKNHATK